MFEKSHYAHRIVFPGLVGYYPRGHWNFENKKLLRCRLETMHYLI